MDPKELRGLMEAYSEVYAPQQIDELSNRKLRAYIKKSGKSHAEINKKWDQGTATDKEKSKSIGHEIGQHRAFKTLDKRTRKEDLDIFDVVLEFLQVEGYAETLEEAEWMMANELDVDDIEEILEAEGSYGKTPKASAAYSALVRKRTNKPASEYSKKGEKTKKVKSAEKHMWRSLRGGPHHGRGKMTADDRTERRSERAFDLETSYGSGSVTKNPKKLRKQKAMGELD
jgi:hypothetical protein